jgi:hypothetical protein
VAKYGSVEAFKTVRKKINGLRNYALNIIYNYFLFNKIIFLSLPGFGIPDSARLHPGYLLSKDLKMRVSPRSPCLCREIFFEKRRN